MHERDDPAFLGRGWSFPPSFSRSAGIGLVAGAEDISQSLWILLSTSLGERVMVPTFGCALEPLLFQAVRVSWLTKLQDVVRTAVLEWEPRITVNRVTAATDERGAGLVLVTIDYTIRATNTRSNLVYPFHVQEATIPPPAP